MGIINDSTLHVHASVLGGTLRGEPQEIGTEGVNTGTSFNKRMGVFSSNHPDSEHLFHQLIFTLRLNPDESGWRPELLRHGWFRCLPCDKAVEACYLEHHEQTVAHKKHLHFWHVEGEESKREEEPNRQSSSEGEYIRGNLGRILANLGGRNTATDVLREVPVDSNEQMINVDWSRSDLCEFKQDETLESHAITALAEDLQRHILNGGAVDMESDDEEAELDEATLNELAHDGICVSSHVC